MNSETLIRKYDLSEIIDDILESLDVIVGPFIILDAEGKYRFANRSFTSALGMDYKEISGKIFTNNVEQSQKENAFNKFEHRNRGEQLKTPYEVTFISKDGKKFKIKWTNAYKTKNGYLSQHGVFI